LAALPFGDLLFLAKKSKQKRLDSISLHTRPVPSQCWPPPRSWYNQNFLY